MIRILHTADVHLDSPLRSLALRDPELRDLVQAATRRAFARIVDAALDHAVAALLISGDLYDGQARSAQTAAFLIGQLERLGEAGVQVFLIRGNHDAENPLTGETALPDNVHLFDARGGKAQLPGHDVWIHGVSFAQKHAPDSLLPKFQTPVAGAVNIAMLHTSLGGASGHDDYAPCSPADLSAMGFDYWALGHIHIRSTQGPSPWIVMPGIPQGRDIGEAGPKSASLLTIEDGQITLSELPTSSVEFQQLEISATEVSREDALRNTLRDAMSRTVENLQSEHAILRLRLTGQTALDWALRRDADVWLETAKTLARDTGRLWVEKLSLDTRPDTETAPTTATHDLSQAMQDMRADTGLKAEAMAEVEAVLAELPPARRATLLPDEAALHALVDHLLEEGAQNVLARMRGAPG